MLQRVLVKGNVETDWFWFKHHFLSRRRDPSDLVIKNNFTIFTRGAGHVKVKAQSGSCALRRLFFCFHQSCLPM